MLARPDQPTHYDLRFQLLGIPVRVHPLFWLVTFLLGPPWDPQDLRPKLLWVLCVFISILVHEFGHGLMARWFGYRPFIALYGMGGLCYSEGERQTFRERLAVISAGPGAGLLLFLLTAAVGYATSGMTLRDDLGLMGFGQVDPTHLRGFPSLYAIYFYVFLIEINLYWSLVNLLPVLPLDGGQLSLNIQTRVNPYHGPRRAYMLSLFAAVLVAVWMFTQRSLFGAIFFAILAVFSFQHLQMLPYVQSYSGGRDEDWWR